MGKRRFKIISEKTSQRAHISFIFSLYLKFLFYLFFDMYGLYDRDGILRFVNSDREACLDYAELFELESAHFCLTNLREGIDSDNNINLDLNQAENNN